MTACPHPKLTTNSRCNECQRVYYREWSGRNKHRIKRYNAKQKARARYGITPEQRDSMLAGLCEMCHERQAACIDHDHTTGLVRGALCNPCNVALGFIEKYSEMAERYLHPMEQIVVHGGSR